MNQVASTFYFGYLFFILVLYRLGLGFNWNIGPFYVQVMTAGQRVSFEFQGINYIFTVNQAAVEGQETSNGIERGMIVNDTYIIFETSKASGIKVSYLSLNFPVICEMMSSLNNFK